MKPLMTLMLFTLATSAFAKNKPSTPGNECTGIIAAPVMNCMNPVSGTDVRLILTEFQDCKDDSITNLDRRFTGVHVLSRRSVDDIHTIDADQMIVSYHPERLLIDYNNRADKLSFHLPKSVVMNDGDYKIEMDITLKMKDFETFKGSFKVTNTTSGKVKSGNLICFVTR